MKPSLWTAAVLALSSPIDAFGQDTGGLGEVVVSANRNNIRYFQQERPVVGLRRQADGAVIAVSISSDSRDAETRRKEIHAVLLAALGRAGAAGVELVSGGYQLEPVTRANYAELPLQWGNRADTSKVDLLVKTRLAGSAAAAEKQLTDFIKAVPRSDRGVIDKTGNLTLTIVEPDQYRDEVIKLVAAEATRNAAIFGPEYRCNISGIDSQLSWTQVSSTDVFLYLPYRYTIYPR
jgi:hypothetical protein